MSQTEDPSLPLLFGKASRPTLTRNLGEPKEERAGGSKKERLESRGHDMWIPEEKVD